jgi:hypothetical protein
MLDPTSALGRERSFKSVKDCLRVTIVRKQIVYNGAAGWYLLELETLHRS